MTATTTRGQASKTRPRRRQNTLLWAAQIALAVVFLVSAVPKLAGAIGLLIPGLAGVAAAGLAADMAGATIINIGILHSAAAIATIALCAVLVFPAWSRREQTGDLAAALRR